MESVGIARRQFLAKGEAIDIVLYSRRLYLSANTVAVQVLLNPTPSFSDPVIEGISVGLPVPNNVE